MHVPSKQDTERLWVPNEVEKLTPSVGGKSLAGGVVVINTFKIYSEKYGKTCVVRIPADHSMSPAEIEDLLATAREECLIRWEEQRQQKVGQHTPSREERLEVGHVLRNIRENAAKRGESSNGRIYYPVVKVSPP